MRPAAVLVNTRDGHYGTPALWGGAAPAQQRWVKDPPPCCGGGNSFSPPASPFKREGINLRGFVGPPVFFFSPPSVGPPPFLTQNRGVFHKGLVPLFFGRIFLCEGLFLGPLGASSGFLEFLASCGFLEGPQIFPH